ncbi:MAG: DUF5677 domain-containing protein [Arenimonas sp.]
MIKQRLKKILAGLPKTVLSKLLARKAKEAGLKIPFKAVEAFAEHLLSGKAGQFVWDDGKNKTELLTLVITEEEIDAAMTKVLDALPETVQKASDVASNRMFEIFCERWPAEHAAQQDEIARFKQRMEERWGEGLGYLRMLLTCSRDIGRETLQRHNRSKSKQHIHRRWVLLRLHARACQVTDEILCLMENGFADGAMARWRTLHELSVVAALIANGDEDLAERYILHDAVELKLQADDYDATQVPLGSARIGKRIRRAIEKQYQAVFNRFGKPFTNPYGWAAKHLNQKKPTFKEIQIAANHASMNSYYKLASFNVHAGARSLFFNLSSMGDSGIVFAGRSNAGLVDPGERAAQSLAFITGLYVGETTDLDRIFELSCLLEVRDAVARSLQKASETLLNEEHARQEKNSARRKRSAPIRSKQNSAKDKK